VKYEHSINGVLVISISLSYNLLVEAKQPKDGRVHPFVKVCEDRHIEHRTTRVKHPWTNGMIEAMNKKIIPTGHNDTVEALKAHLYAYVLSYNFNLKLRAIGRKTPFDAILDFYRKTPAIFMVNPNQLIKGERLEYRTHRSAAARTRLPPRARKTSSVSHLRAVLLGGTSTS